jgi:PAS domain S-box-containing protein
MADAAKRHTGPEDEGLYLRLIAEHMLDVVCQASAEGVIEYTSPSCERVLGHEPGFALGRRFFELVHPDDKARVVAAWERSHRDNASFHEEVRLPGGHGVFRWFEIVGRFVCDETGRPLNAVLSCRDIERRRQAEEALLQAERERRELEARIHREQRVESLSLLAGGIAHDFSNLLTTILANADMALQELSPHSGAYDSVRQIELAAWRATRITRQMLAYAGRDRQELKEIHLSELIRRTSHLLESSVSEKTEVICDLAEEVPPVEGDSAQIRQVLVNLVSNASEAIGKRNGIVRIRTGYDDYDEETIGESFADWAAPAGRYVYVEISDNGSGMSAQMRERLFDPFYSTRFVGRGLGLPAVQGIVRSHRGAVAVKSGLGRGTTVTVLLPASSPEPCRVQEGKSAGKAGRLPSSGVIVVVESDEAVGDAAKRILEEMQCKVVLVRDGAKAVRAFRNRHPAVKALMVDHRVAPDGAAKVVDAVRRIDAHLPVLLTGSVSREEAAADLGGREVLGFLQKPYRREDLLEALREVLSLRNPPSA